MIIRKFVYVLALSSIVLACGQSNNRDKGSGDTSESIDGLLPDTSDTATTGLADSSHLDENNDQRGTRIQAGPDSANRKQ
ncbi:hypothetical protein BDE36_3667 [Arcticibacter tournemirensis]|uniref:Lipoprotein n=1 Tax=Arcticibacter tournemirensis TaxID=699437 RepID=A0A5M9HBP9_9SPHI|nr:hypothetical protein [Arcticibacter tournemirensis]KAA8484130.1 hypothetical protein F1649_07265 [Arcticibacter tournemirensis]TQM51874.1 hypothetical protein BDE36_3667 [Arcticibacter tournemirensis]